VNIEVSFVRSAVGASDLPGDGLAEIALVGRSNVGKSRLNNALVRQRVARTSATPGEPGRAHAYRLTPAGRPPMYLLDLPGYGYARGGDAGFEALAGSVFVRQPVGLLLVDARHPGLDADRQAWAWMRTSVAVHAIVATKIDKLSRAERLRATRTLEAVFEDSVLPVSAVTGEGLDELWTLIDRLLNNHLPRSNRLPKATAPPPATARRPPPFRRRKS
jgi:GTP-binding protein